jgi:type III secretory pathway component EscS
MIRIIPSPSSSPDMLYIKKESKLVPLAVIIAALAGLLISIFVARASLPVFLYYIAVILLLAIFLLLFYGFLGEPIYNFIKKRRKIRKRNAPARKYFNKFKHFTETFGEFVDPNRSDITEVPKNLQSDHLEFRELLFLPKGVNLNPSININCKSF